MFGVVDARPDEGVQPLKKSMRTIAVTVTAAAALSLAACGAGDGDGSEGVTIVVGDRPSADQEQAVENLEETIEEFEAAHPDVTVESVETKWEVQTFQAMLAGGTMPTTMNVPFTEPQSLIAAGQIADITEPLEEVGLADQLNPSVISVAQDGESRFYGVPVDVYSVGLAYNRDLFEEAGLDPDSPPTTWQQVREYAQVISQVTGATGYATYTADGFGGWMTTAAVYSFGGQIQDEEGTTATVDTPEVRAYLELLQDMRWEDDSMGSNFVYSADPAIQDFAAGRIGMMLNLPLDYPGLVRNYGMDPESYGFTALPQATDASRTLTGGAVRVFSPHASDEELRAAVEWTQFANFRQYLDEEVAIEKAQAAQEDGDVVGVPVLSPVDQESYDRLREWTEPYATVILANWEGYTSVAESQQLVPEPRTRAQETYGELDRVLQAVLTREDADLDSLLPEAEDTINALMAR